MSFKRTHFCGLLMLLFLPPSMAQLEPCGFYEWNNQNPGYGDADLRWSTIFWLDHGSLPNRPDFNGDSQVDMLDFVMEASCVRDLNHGLLGKYYGFDTGNDEDITFPDFDNLPGNQGPAVVLATEMLEELESFSGFMDSDMRFQFGAVFSGYLFAPETANYNLHIFGDRGMRVFIDDAQVMAFDTFPREDSTSMQLSYGLHPIRVEFYAAHTAPRILLDWSSDGEIVGPVAETIGPAYLYHLGETVDENIITDLEVFFDPPSGSRGTQFSDTIDVFVLGPGHDYRLSVDGGADRILREGYASADVSLVAGMNEVVFNITDEDGTVKDFIYNIYVDQEVLDSPGLEATIYGAEWYRYPMPDLDDFLPYAHENNPGTRLEPDSDDFTRIANRYLSDGAMVELEGAITSLGDGLHTFRLRGPGALFINGEQVCAIGFDYRDQWVEYGEIELIGGKNHYRLVTGYPRNAPEVNVQYAIGEGNLIDIPDSAFSHGPNHGGLPNHPTVIAHGGRVSEDLQAEYIFRPEGIWEDTSGNGYHLLPDPRAIGRENGGITYQSGGCLSTEQGGQQLITRAKLNNGLTLEADIIPHKVFTDWREREVISLSAANWDYLARVFIRNDDLYFRFHDENDVFEEIVAENIVQENVRLHIMGMYTGSEIRLMVNGNQVASAAYAPAIQKWPSLGKLNIGQPYMKLPTASTRDRQMIGTFLVAAAYYDDLLNGSVNVNYSRNLEFRPTPPALPVPDVVAFPPAGTTPEQLSEAHHYLKRLTFGPSIEDLIHILDVGPTQFISDQMNVDQIDDSQMEEILAADYFRPIHYERDLQAQALFRMTYSKRQLLEVMTQFWENHFNTQYSKVNELYEEQAENDRFRELALTNFSDLLRASAMNYPMTVYLDNDTNIVSAPNENYAREFFELHTMGVNNGYTHEDILEAARCFTGWTTRNGKLYFNPGLHDFGAKSVVGLEIPAGGGMQDGISLIEYMVSRRETADFITWKLCQLFIADDPPADVWQAASDAFFNFHGDIKQTLLAIFNHPRFASDLTMRSNKVKTPLEFVASTARIGDAFPMAIRMNDYLLSMGMELFNFADPTGFAEEGVAWIDTNANLTRWNLVNDLTSNRGGGNLYGMNFERFITKRGLVTSDQLLDFFEAITVHGAQPAGARAIMEDWMTQGNPGGFILNEETLNNEVRQTFGLFMRLPEINKQ